MNTLSNEKQLNINTLNKKELKKYQDKINLIFKRDNKSSYDAKWNDKLFDFMIVKTDNTNNYLTGNFGLMISHIDSLLKDKYIFSFGMDSMLGIIERFMVITGDIKVDCINCYDMNKYYNNIITGKELDIIKIKKKRINFNNMDRTNLKKKFSNQSVLMEYITDKIKLSNTFVDNDVLIYLTEDKKQITCVNNVCKYMKNNFHNLYTNQVSIKSVVMVE